jgi:hypothetical protein
VFAEYLVLPSERFGFEVAQDKPREEDASVAPLYVHNDVERVVLFSLEVVAFQTTDGLDQFLY